MVSSARFVGLNCNEYYLKEEGRSWWEKSIVKDRLYPMEKDPCKRAEGIGAGLEKLIQYTGTSIIPTVIGLQEQHHSDIARRLAMQDVREMFGAARLTMNNLLIPRTWRVAEFFPVQVLKQGTSYPDCFNLLSAIVVDTHGQEYYVGVTHFDEGYKINQRDDEADEVLTNANVKALEYGIPAVILCDGNQITKYDIRTQQDRLARHGYVNVVGNVLPTCDERQNEIPGLRLLRTTLKALEPAIIKVKGNEVNERIQYGTMALDMIMFNPAQLTCRVAGVYDAMPQGYTDHNPTFAVFQR
jgi:hypothetical protein